MSINIRVKLSPNSVFQFHRQLKNKRENYTVCSDCRDLRARVLWRFMCVMCYVRFIKNRGSMLACTGGVN